jgi:hypothetical protein
VFVTNFPRVKKKKDEIRRRLATVQFRNCLPVSYWSSQGAGIAQWYRAGMMGVRVPAGAGNFTLHRRVQTGSGAHATSYTMGTRGCFPGG